MLSLETIASDLMGIETLKNRGSDRLDFHEVSVSQVRAGLKAAFEAGAESARVVAYEDGKAAGSKSAPPFAHLTMPTLRSAAEAVGHRAENRGVAISWNGRPMIVSKQTANQLEVDGHEFYYVSLVHLCEGSRVVTIPCKETPDESCGEVG